jgi:hypothetical protein
MEEFSRKVEEAFRNVETKIHEAAPRLNEKVAGAGAHIEKDAKELIAYLNNEVVPAIRTQSTKVLRVASEKLNELAAYIEQHRQG